VLRRVPSDHAPRARREGGQLCELPEYGAGLPDLLFLSTSNGKKKSLLFFKEKIIENCEDIICLFRLVGLSASLVVRAVNIPPFNSKPSKRTPSA
jgi:hypothetical protein